MSRFRSILVGVALATVPVVGAAGVYALVETGNAAAAASIQVKATGSTLAKLDAVLSRIGSKTGTVAMLDEDLGTLKSAVVHLDLIARHEQQQLTTLDAQERELFTKAGKAIDAVTGTANGATALLGTTNTTLLAEQPKVDAVLTNSADLLAKSSVLLTNGDGAVTDFRRALANPDLALMEQHFAGITASADHMMFTADAVETKATHNYLHPSTNPWVRAGQAVKPFLVPMAQVGGAVAISLH